MHLASATANLLTHVFDNAGETVGADVRMGVHKYVGRGTMLAKDAENLLYIPTLLRSGEKLTVRVSGYAVNFVKLTKETWQFYLTALCVILLPVVSNNMYVLRELKLQKENTVHLYKLSEEFLEKTNGGDLLSFWVVIAGIVILLFIRHFLFMDRRTMEFQFSLPVKKRMMNTIK